MDEPMGGYPPESWKYQRAQNPYGTLRAISKWEVEMLARRCMTMEKRIAEQAAKKARLE